MRIRIRRRRSVDIVADRRASLEQAKEIAVARDTQQSPLLGAGRQRVASASWRRQSKRQRRAENSGNHDLSTLIFDFHDFRLCCGQAGIPQIVVWLGTSLLTRDIAPIITPSPITFLNHGLWPDVDDISAGVQIYTHDTVQRAVT